MPETLPRCCLRDAPSDELSASRSYSFKKIRERRRVDAIAFAGRGNLAEKIEYLDGLRGLAAFIVVLHHFVCTFYPAMAEVGKIYHLGPVEGWLGNTPFSLLFGGNFPVCVFFILSGYVLTYKFFKTKNREVIVSGAVRRYLRLIFPIAFVIFLAYLMMSLSLFYNQEIASLTGSSWNKQFWTFDQDFSGMIRQAVWDTLFIGSETATSYDYVLWTMSIEFVGSLIAFSYVMLFGQSRNRWAIYLIAGVFFIDSYYLAFLLGILLADLYNSERPAFKFDNKIALLALLVIGLYLGSYTGSIAYPGHDLFNIAKSVVTEPDIFWHIIGAFILVFVVLNSPLLKSGLSKKVPVSLGKLSFSMYLIHPLILASISSVSFMVLSEYLAYNWAGLIVFLITVAAVIVSSYFIYRYVDQPGIFLSKNIYEKYFAGQSKPLDWKGVGNRVIEFVGKNVAVFIIMIIILLMLTGSVVFIIKPNMESAAVEQNKIAYYEYNNYTVHSYRDLSSYEKANYSSIGVFRGWLNGYDVRYTKFTSNYEKMKLFGDEYKPYANETEYQCINSDILFYGEIVNETQVSYENYRSTYYAWYWNNTAPCL